MITYHKRSSADQPQLSTGGVGKPPKNHKHLTLGGNYPNEGFDSYRSQRTYEFGKQYVNTLPNKGQMRLW